METLPDIDNGSKQMLQSRFFQQPENDALAALFYSELLPAFMLMLMLILMGEDLRSMVRNSARSATI